ncbi:MAG: aminomethyl-transferring glycine dehydrogenase subunit GcvPA, partial [Candidatus Omnitrophota bacterium]
MLTAIGVRGTEELLGAVPESLRHFKWDVPEGLSEIALERRLRKLAAANQNLADSPSFLGAGVYDHHVPPVVNALAMRSEFLTAYTPYQGEASQGTLQSIYEYQTMICELTGMDASNASMYDGASATAEAAVLALRHTERKKIVIARSVHPETRQTVRTYLSFFGAEIVEIPLRQDVADRGLLERAIDESTAAVIVQQPNFFGTFEDLAGLAELARAKGALVVANVNPISLGIAQAPAEFGADIAVGDGQPLGNAQAFGGPHFGFFAVRQPLLRKMPGRIVGKTVDNKGRPAYVLTLQAREQHIRREKATSNICTNHALCAFKAAIYLGLLGASGLRQLALINMQKARQARKALLAVKG